MDLSAQLWVQAIANGLAIGWLYVLMGLGLTLIVSIMNILQLAHGEVYMLGAYIVYFVCTYLGISVYVAMPVSMAAMAAFGVLIERFLFRPVRGQMLAPIVISVGLTLILTSGAAAGFGLYERRIPRLAVGYFDIFGSALPKDRAVAVAFSVVLLMLLYLFIKKTILGQAMAASAQSREGALLRGISPNQMSAIAMAIGCALAAAGGTLAGSIYSLGPSMGTQPLLKGLVIIVLGGTGSLLGAAIGGMILGLIDGVIPVVFGPAVASLLPLIIVILILLLRPQGLLGRE